MWMREALFPNMKFSRRFARSAQQIQCVNSCGYVLEKAQRLEHGPHSLNVYRLLHCARFVPRNTFINMIEGCCRNDACRILRQI